MSMSTSMTRARRFLRRTAADRRLLVRALVLHACVASLLRIVRLGTLSDWLHRYGNRRSASSHPLDSAAINRIVWAVRQAAAAAPLGRTCLTEALTAAVMLQRAGCDATLRYGVTAEEGNRLAAHAWLEHDGVEIIGGSSRFYEPLNPSVARIA
jgi:hypothetical protein